MSLNNEAILSVSESIDLPTKNEVMLCQINKRKFLNLFFL